YVIPEETPKLDAKNIDPKATSLRLADAAFAQGEYAMAAQLYFRAAELQPEVAEPKIKLGFALFKAGGAGDAEKVFRVALEKEPKNADALRGLAHALLTQGRAGEALPVYRQAIAASNKPDARIYAGLGAALDMVGKHQEARAAYEAGLKLAPQDFGLRNNLALSYAMSGDTAKARAILSSLSENPAPAPKAHQSLPALNAAAPAPAATARQNAETAAVSRIDAPAEPRDIAELPAPTGPAPRATRKALADMPIADAG